MLSRMLAVVLLLFVSTTSLFGSLEDFSGSWLNRDKNAQIDSYSFVTAMAAAFLALQAQSSDDSNGAVARTINASALQMDCMLCGRREKDPDCVLFCSEPTVHERFRSKYSN